MSAESVNILKVAEAVKDLRRSVDSMHKTLRTSSNPSRNYTEQQIAREVPIELDWTEEGLAGMASMTFDFASDEMTLQIRMGPLGSEKLPNIIKVLDIQGFRLSVVEP